MRHRVVTKKLNRDAPHRKALLRNMASSMILNDKIDTTLAKAKYLRPYIERLITKAKANKDHTAIAYAQNKLFSEDAVRKLFSDISVRFATRNGGYTRIVRTGNRAGDNGLTARIEFVEKKAEDKTKAKKASKTKKETEEVKTVKEPKEVKEPKAAKEVKTEKESN